MKVNEISVTVNQRIQLMKFEGIAPVIQMTASLDNGDDPSKCTAELFTMARKNWAKEAMKQIRWYSHHVEDKEKFTSISQPVMLNLKKMAAGN